MKRLLPFLLLAALALSAAGCAGKKAPQLAVYTVKAQDTRAAFEVGLLNVVLEEEPVFTAADMDYYEWSTHTLKLKRDSLNKIPSQVSVTGSPFVLTVNGERVYLGAFWTPISSVSAPPGVPIILIQSDPLKIELGYPQPSGSGADPRNDNRIHTALGQLGKLRK